MRAKWALIIHAYTPSRYPTDSRRTSQSIYKNLNISLYTNNSRKAVRMFCSARGERFYTSDAKPQLSAVRRMPRSQRFFFRQYNRDNFFSLSCSHFLLSVDLRLGFGALQMFSRAVRRGVASAPRSLRRQPFVTTTSRTPAIRPALAQCARSVTTDAAASHVEREKVPQEDDKPFEVTLSEERSVARHVRH